MLCQCQRRCGCLCRLAEPVREHQTQRPSLLRDPKRSDHHSIKRNVQGRPITQSEDTLRLPCPPSLGEVDTELDLRLGWRLTSSNAGPCALSLRSVQNSPERLCAIMLLLECPMRNGACFPDLCTWGRDISKTSSSGPPWGLSVPCWPTSTSRRGATTLRQRRHLHRTNLRTMSPRACGRASVRCLVLHARLHPCFKHYALTSGERAHDRCHVRRARFRPWSPKAPEKEKRGRPRTPWCPQTATLQQGWRY